jgi:hypothetical protein
MWSRRRILGGAALVVLVASVPTVADAAAGHSYGGFTAQNWPIAIEVSRDRREVVRAGMGFELKCTSGIRVDLDRYSDLVLHRDGRFRASYSNLRSNLPDGTYFIYGGSLAGRLNKARTGISGTVNLNYVKYDAAGAVLDTCDSGKVKYKAR